MTYRAHLTLLVGLAIAVTACMPPAKAPQPNTLTATELKEGWKLLFDGQTIDQWRGFRSQTMPGNWGVVDGALTLTQVDEGPDIITREQFSDFDFKFEWKLTPAPPPGNSGVMFYVTEESDATYHTGPEYQILDNAAHDDGKNPLTSAGSCYALYAPERGMTRPVGTWNEGRIVVNKGRVEHWLNGEKTVEYDLNSQEWKAKVAASKFKDWPPFGLARRGHIALQQHDAPVAYRNLKIRRLDAK
jgi:hypothetical protein